MDLTPKPKKSSQGAPPNPPEDMFEESPQTSIDLNVELPDERPVDETDIVVSEDVGRPSPEKNALSDSISTELDDLILNEGIKEDKSTDEKPKEEKPRDDVFREPKIDKAPLKEKDTLPPLNVSPVSTLPPSKSTSVPINQSGIGETVKSAISHSPSRSPSPHIESQPFPHHQPGEILTALLRFMVEKRASDLHLRAGTPVFFRVDGNLVAFDRAILGAELAKDLLYYMLPVRQRKIFEAKNEADFSFAVPNIGRFRGNAFRQRGSVAVVLRQIPTTIPNFTELNLPSVMEKFCKLSRGLVLVCGPTGSGKSTALAAMISKINEDRAEHIVTIEDPIEFLHRDNKSIISQRELGTDTISFSEALKHVLRQDPDVVLLGEMRDLETTSTAITAAQTGHLVLSTLHTTDAVQTINRIIDLYPPHQQQQVRYQLADVLKGVICLRLLPQSRGVGRIPTCEILVVTALVRKAIADNKMTDVQEAIRQGQYYGMQTFHQSLLKLYKEGHVKLDDALEAASNPEELMMAIRGITQGTEGT